MTSNDTGRFNHTECTGLALENAKAHSKATDITLFAGWFCPFVQRVWVALEALGIDYRVSVNLESIATGKLIICYYEIDPYKKPQSLLDVSPKGLVPAIRFERFNPPRALNESTVIMEYLQDLATTTTKKSLLPPVTNPYARGLVRLQADHITRTIVPGFYRFLQAQETEKQIAAGKEYREALEVLVKLFERIAREVVLGHGVSGIGERTALLQGLGLWFDGQTDLGWVDIMGAPWLFRTRLVLKHYRGFELPASLARYVGRLEQHPHFVGTCSEDGPYIENYEKYAFNRPKTSLVAKAVNEGTGLP